MAEFTHKSAKNASTRHMPFELNCGYHPRISYKEKVNFRSQFKSADEISTKLRKLIVVCCENLHHAQKLLKQDHNNRVKSQIYAPGEKIWLNSKYIKTKRNCKLKAKFFELFWVLYPIGKQEYKLELSKKWRIYDVFHVSLLEQNTTSKGRVNENVVELDASNKCGKYKVKAIWHNAVYAKESKSGHQSGLYYLVSWKKYPEEENIWELASVIKHLRKLISLFHKNHSNKLIVTFSAINIALPIARLTAKPTEPFKWK